MAASVAHDLANAPSVITLTGVNKWFGQFHVLTRHQPRRQARARRSSICGPVGLGQVDPDPLHQPPGGAPGRATSSSTASTLTNDVKNIEAIRREVGMVFQSFNLFPHLTILENLHPGADLGEEDAARRTPRRSR